MSLAERVDRLANPDRPAETAPLVVSTPESAAPEVATREMTQRIVDHVRDAIQDTPDRSQLSDAKLRSLVEQRTTEALAAEGPELGRRAVSAIRRSVADELLGFGPLQTLLDDHTVSEIMINGHETVFVERSGRVERVESTFDTSEQLRLVVERMVQTPGGVSTSRRRWSMPDFPMAHDSMWFFHRWPLTAHLSPSESSRPVT